MNIHKLTYISNYMISEELNFFNLQYFYKFQKNHRRKAIISYI
jgi:hypothetical protein